MRSSSLELLSSTKIVTARALLRSDEMAKLQALLPRLVLLAVALVYIGAAMDSSSSGESSTNSPVSPIPRLIQSEWQDGLPSDQDLHIAMTRRPFREGMRLYNFREPGPPWLPSHTSRHNFGSAHSYIPPFTRATDGFHYGPLSIGGFKFRLLNYPHDLPFLRDTYAIGSGWVPIDFELLKEGRTLHRGSWIFRPEPLILGDVQSAFDRWYRLQHRLPERVKKAYGLKHAQFAWPPVDIQPVRDADRLWMPFDVVSHLRAGVVHRMALHGSDMPFIYRLTVPTFGGDRHIMMTLLDAVMNTEMQERSKESDFWLLTEALARPENLQATRERFAPIYAVLGGMFLPKDAPELFKQHMEPAFVHAR